MLEKFKDNLQRRIENNTYKSELSYEDNDGNIHTEIVLLKKSKMPIFGDWARIYPPIDENRKILWFNLIFGGKRNFIKLIGIIIIISLFFLGYYEAYSNYNALINNDCVQTCLNIIP